MVNDKICSWPKINMHENEDKALTDAACFLGQVLDL